VISGVRDALRLIVSEHGESALSDPRLMTILLGDCLQGHPADQALLAAAAQEDFGQESARASSGRHGLGRRFCSVLDRPEPYGSDEGPYQHACAICTDG
jgi:hypothetical protein